ncbi:MAG: SoxR reducing system RseC family protein [Gammaproteobacteria bacterium]|nr:SoxR reducing system RseC family protein [Gammaproteobacteria bacterium]
MMTETAQVISTEGKFAWVETQRKTTCGSCAAQKGCGTGVLAKVFGNRTSRVRVINTIGAESGEMVVIGLEDGTLVRTSFAVYAMPLVFLLLGGAAGGMLADALAWETREGAAAVCGVLGLLLGFAWLRRYTRSISQDPRHQPSLIGFADADDPDRTVAVDDIMRDYRRKDRIEVTQQHRSGHES